MKKFENLVELRAYCREAKWPRLAQWMHWIYSKNPIALICVKKIGGRYLIDLEALENHIKKATLE